jgi:hypothetical protein
VNIAELEVKTLREIQKAREHMQKEYDKALGDQSTNLTKRFEDRLHIAGLEIGRTAATNYQNIYGKINEVESKFIRDAQDIRNAIPARINEGMEAAKNFAVEKVQGLQQVQQGEFGKVSDAMNALRAQQNAFDEWQRKHEGPYHPHNMKSKKNDKGNKAPNGGDPGQGPSNQPPPSLPWNPPPAPPGSGAVVAGNVPMREAAGLRTGLTDVEMTPIPPSIDWTKVKKRKEVKSPTKLEEAKGKEKMPTLAFPPLTTPHPAIPPIKNDGQPILTPPSKEVRPSEASGSRIGVPEAEQEVPIFTKPGKPQDIWESINQFPIENLQNDGYFPRRPADVPLPDSPTDSNESSAGSYEDEQG